MSNITVSAMYHFAILEDFEKIREPLCNFMKELGIKGTILLAREGINGTVAGSDEAIKKMHEYLRSDPRLKDVVTKESYASEMPFHRTKVKLKKEIVTMGVEGIDPKHISGTYVKPKDWNDLISDPDVIIVDTRNDYEVAIGTFKNALNPETETFREFPKYAEENLKDKKKKVAMFCTGGIRCEKSTAYLKAEGFDEVYHLEGGILKYLEEVPKQESLWEGDCFVFDSRVAVTHGLEESEYIQCFACRMPILEEDRLSPHYAEGVSCHHCFEKQSEKQKQRHLERQKQLERAKELGIEHIGSDATKAIEIRREMKLKAKEEERENRT